MRNLDRINPAFAKPNRFVSLMAWLPIILGGLGMALASGAAENVGLFSNPVWVLCFLIMGGSSIMLVVPRIFKWDWRAEYFWAGTLLLGSMLMLGGIPWACFLVYGALPLALRIALFLGYLGVIIWWGWRFVPMYRKICDDIVRFRNLYHEDAEAYYYIQKVDKRFLDVKSAPRHTPAAVSIVSSFALGLLALFFARPLVAQVGLPFVHIFLGIVSVPLDMIAAGAIVRGYLIYRYYPRKIFLNTGKRVYVDMATSA